MSEERLKPYERAQEVLQDETGRRQVAVQLGTLLDRFIPDPDIQMTTDEIPLFLVSPEGGPGTIFASRETGIGPDRLIVRLRDHYEVTLLEVSEDFGLQVLSVLNEKKLQIGHREAVQYQDLIQAMAGYYENSPSRELTGSETASSN